MKVVAPADIQDKKVLLRLDIDVPLEKFGVQSSEFRVGEEFRLRAGLPTLNLCLEHGKEVAIMGHLGRPEGRFVPELSVEPVYDWLVKQGYGRDLAGKLKLLENLRFEEGEEKGDMGYASELASFGEVYINEAFAAHHPAASTTVLPTLLPHFAGLNFAKEVGELSRVRDNPAHPFVVIVGGIKIEDKLPALITLEKKADQVLVGGKISEEIKEHPDILKSNIFLAKLNREGTDISLETIKGWVKIISQAKMVVWNGPLGKIDNGQWTMDNLGSERGSYEIAEAIINSGAESMIGGGDTIGFLGKLGLLGRFSFISTGGGAMLKFLAEGTLPTIEALS